MTSQDCFLWDVLWLWQITFILTSQSGPSTLKLQVFVCQNVSGPSSSLRYETKQWASAKSLDGAWHLQTLHMLCDGILQQWALVLAPENSTGPRLKARVSSFSLPSWNKNLGNFHWYWDITARRPASWHPLVNMSTPQVSVPTSAKTLLPPASVPAALLMMVSPQPSATTITAYFWRFITWSLPRIHRLGQLQNEKERWRRSTTTTTTTTTAQWSESILVLERNMLQRILESKVWKNTNSPEHSTDLYAFPKHPTYSTTVTSYMGGHCDALAPMGGPNAHHATPNSGNYEYNLGIPCQMPHIQ